MVNMVTFQFDNGSVDVPKTISLAGKRYQLWGVERAKDKSKVKSTAQTLKLMKMNKIYSGVRTKKFGNGKFIAFYVRK